MSVLHGYMNLVSRFAHFLRCSGSHQRSILFPLGNQGYAFCALGNVLASRMALFMIYSMVGGARWLLEQPGGSVAELHTRLGKLLNDYFVYKTGIWGGAFADDCSTATPKRHQLFSNDKQMLERLAVAAGKLSAEDFEQLQGERLTKKYRKPDGSYGYAGNGGYMKASQYQPKCV